MTMCADDYLVKMRCVFLSRIYNWIGTFHNQLGARETKHGLSGNMLRHKRSSDNGPHDWNLQSIWHKMDFVDSEGYDLYVDSSPVSARKRRSICFPSGKAPGRMNAMFVAGRSSLLDCLGWRGCILTLI